MTGQRTASALGPMTGGNVETTDNDHPGKGCKEDDPAVPMIVLAPARAEEGKEGGC